MTTFERKWKTLLATAASAASQASRIPGGPLLTAESTTSEIEAWLHWNDPNGCHLPAQCEAEGFEPYRDDTAWETLGSMILDNASPAWVAEYERAVEDAMIAERAGEATPTTYTIESSDGTAIGQGIQGRDAAVKQAQHTAETTGRTVYVVAEDGSEQPETVAPAAAERR